MLIATIFARHGTMTPVLRLKFDQGFNNCALADQPESVSAAQWRMRLDEDYAEAAKAFDV